VGLVVILALLSLAGALVVFGYRIGPAHSARWPLAARVIEERADLFVITGLAMLAAGVTWLLLFVIVPIA
jgi:hypothetical protein